DRWAETIRLLFDMVDEKGAELLIAEFVNGMRHPETWDIATRVLSDLGPRVAPYAARELRQPDEMVAVGAAQILGRIRAQMAVDTLRSLASAKAWRVRRAAV